MQDDAQDDPESLLHRAARFREFGEFAAAKDVLTRAVEQYPSFKKGWLRLGEIHEDLGNMDKARTCYQTAISLDFEWKEPLVHLGKLDFSLKQYHGAVRTLKAYLKLGGDDISALLILAQSAYNLDDCKTVLTVTAQITNMDENIYEAWEMRGLCHARMSNFSSALVSLNMALELNPKSVTALNAVGDLCYDSGNYEGAVSFFTPSITKRKKQPRVLFRLGTALWFLDKWSDSIFYLEQYTELVPDDAIGWNNLGVALREKGEVTRSLECYRRALKINPHLEVAKTNMTTAMNKQVIP
ncbi:tetratricopeptide repeat protein [Candidatus Thorarchaeota archaeon]|nr:MAG: tetratricopeptide repeat protein [Candidatus Thorarchaeota archaeon]